MFCFVQISKNEISLNQIAGGAGGLLDMELVIF